MTRAVTSLSVGVATAALARTLPHDTNLHYIAFLVAAAHDSAQAARRTLRSYSEKAPTETKKKAFLGGLLDRQTLLNECLANIPVANAHFVLGEEAGEVGGLLILNDTQYKLL